MFLELSSVNEMVLCGSNNLYSFLESEIYFKCYDFPAVIFILIISSINDYNILTILLAFISFMPLYNKKKIKKKNHLLFKFWNFLVKQIVSVCKPNLFKDVLYYKQDKLYLYLLFLNQFKAFSKP